MTTLKKSKKAAKNVWISGETHAALCEFCGITGQTLKFVVEKAVSQHISGVLGNRGDQAAELREMVNGKRE